MVKSVAEMDEAMAGAAEAISAADHYCSYETFGVRFFEHAITPERIHAAMSGLVGREFEFGPKKLGPVRVARIAATGRIDDVIVTPRAGRAVAFRVVIPVDLHLTVRLAAQNHRFHVDMRAGLTLAARAAEPLRVIIDVTPPAASDIEVTVRARSLRASILRAVTDVDGELRRFVARFVAREIEKPHIKRLREIDVASRIGEAW